MNKLIRFKCEACGKTFLSFQPYFYCDECFEKELLKELIKEIPNIKKESEDATKRKVRHNRND
jgi:DNA-directed RNA polymerase subunit RPC12/RpoP